MLLRLCQLKYRPLFVLPLLLLGSCSWRKSEQRNPVELITTFSNDWFSANKNHSLINTDDKAISHLLFDTTPEFKSSERTVHVIIATPEGSPHNYSIDLSSGQRFYTHSYCKQNDVWSEYNSSIKRPMYSVGYIPRVLDQLGEPQKVIVWTKSDAFKRTALSNYHEVRLIGAFVEQICPEGNCLGKNNWMSRLVFVGLDAEDSSLAAIQTLDQFKEVFNWDASKAHLQNLEGRNAIGDKTYPFNKIGQLIGHDEAFDFFKKRSIFLTDVELKKIQKGCHNLYDRLWDEVGKTRPEDRAATNKKELDQKLKLTADLKKKKLPVGFAARFRRFSRKYFNEVTTCEKFVYHGNLNKDQEAFWFLSYMGIFYRLHREGYYFDCNTKTWQRNILNEKGEPVYDMKRDIGSCKEYQIDQAMAYLPNFLSGLKGEKEFFRFIDYDNHTFGSHQKMYTWVKMKSRKFDCGNDPNTEIKKEMRLFPEDVVWKTRFVKDTAEGSEYIR
jgi:hypothetical protein